MIELTSIRLVNWYGFHHTTVPVGSFTLIAGKNGNGKSVLLDAIRYAAYGDTVFNKSSENRGSRTIASYTRGLLDASARTYMRPAEKMPTVYSHIALEYFDDTVNKYFVLGTIIETNASNNVQTFRYVMDQTRLDEIAHTYRENGAELPYGPSAFSRTYQVPLQNRERGIPQFMQMTGLKLSLPQTGTYLRKLRGIMSYDPEAKIDRFIKDSVLEDKKVDFTKLIEAKENIARLTQTFEGIEQEISELDEILEAFSKYRRQVTLLRSDDIRTAYIAVRSGQDGIRKLHNELELTRREQAEAAHEHETLREQEQQEREQLSGIRDALGRMDSVRILNESRERLKELEDGQARLRSEADRLAAVQTHVSEALHLLAAAEPARDAAQKEVLTDLTEDHFRTVEKEQAVEGLRNSLDAYYDDQIRQEALTQERIYDLDDRIRTQQDMIDACDASRDAFARIPEEVAVRDAINREYAKRGIQAEAKFACEYVVSLEDERFRDAIEAFLGRRRYTILVPPEQYAVAEEVFNRLKNRHAHLFNTRLLMQKEIRAEEGTAAELLVVRNPVARRFFDYQLGRMKAVPLQEISRYEYAISREGRVSVAMDSYFLRFDAIRFYCLGQESLELNRRRAEQEAERLRQEKKELLQKKSDLRTVQSQIKSCRAALVPCDYEAENRLRSAGQQIRELQKTIEELEAAQKNNTEYLQLHMLEETVGKRLQDLLLRASDAYDRQLLAATKLGEKQRRLEEADVRLSQAEQQLAQFRETWTALTEQVTESYDRYLVNGRKGPGGPIQPLTRRRTEERMEQYKNQLLLGQGEYRVRHPELAFGEGVDCRNEYESRRQKIWVDDLQEIRARLEDQTRRYELIFKNEFVLNILKYCTKAREDLKLMNLELRRLDFPTQYAFDCHYAKDQSDYAKIIEYARYLEEKEQYGGGRGQLLLGAVGSWTPEQGAALEQDIQAIINRIIARNDIGVIERFADYRNYMTYEILLSNNVLDKARLSEQSGYNSGSEVQIPYLLILASALLMIYNEKLNSTRLVFIDEPFAKMDPGNVRTMLRFFREQKLQVIFCAPDKIETIGRACDVILPVLRVSADDMQIGVVEFHEKETDGRNR